MSIKDNLTQILQNIENSKKNSKFTEDVTLLAVTKFRTTDEIKEVLDFGINNLGENKVKEFETKYEFFKGEDINWHLSAIFKETRLKNLIGKTALIHSVDSIRLMEEINKQSEKKML
ncbi:MAG: hypothetical protein ACLRQZ_07005 [Clostridia bacterium]